MPAENAENPPAPAHDPAAARLDRATENELYALFRAAFAHAEDYRNWNLWEDVPWDRVQTEPSEELVEAVLESLRAEIFLPDYTTHSLRILRASRGRTWFQTRWNYEESKHQIALGEWLMQAAGYTEPELREMTEALLTEYRWEPPYSDGVAMVAEALMYELREQERYTRLRAFAADAHDEALGYLLDRVLTDEAAHRAFFAGALNIIAVRYPDDVADALQRIASLQPNPEKAQQALEAALAAEKA
jgi:hypothetical protein